MSKENVEIVRRCWQAVVNRGDYSEWRRSLAENAVLVDNPTGARVEGREQWIEAVSSIFVPFPEWSATDLQFLDADEQNTVIVLSTFTAEDSGSGFMGLPASGRRASGRWCVLHKFNFNEEIVEVENFYDNLGFLIEFGHIDNQLIRDAVSLQVPAPTGVHYND